MNPSETTDKSGLLMPHYLEVEPDFMENRLKETLRRAHRSPLYRELWKSSSFTPDMFNSLDDLHLIPFLNRRELFEATRKRRSKICVEPVSHWFMGYDQTDVYEWFPYSIGDFLGIAPNLARMSRAVGLREGDIILAIVDVPPKISSLIPYLWSYSDVSSSVKLEFIVGSMDWYDTMGMTWINFIQKRRPTVIFASTRNAQALADRIQKTMGAQVRDILPETRVGIFYGNNMEIGMTHLLESYSLEPFEVYSPTEHMSFCSECGSHHGTHFWLDTAIPEVIPTGLKESQPIWKAKPSTEGELVLTNFAECLPLIRYKTGTTIRVEGTDRCECGLTDPRISPCTGATALVQTEMAVK